MKRYLNFAILLSVMALLSACSTVPKQPVNSTASLSESQVKVHDQLLKHYGVWRGTPYRLGGLSKQGIDCSGLVVVTYQSVFGLQVPRTTSQLVDAGSKVPQDKLQTGDLIFFRTGFKQHHVGIYLAEGRFFHASTSQGVITSSLDSPYWSDAYHHARRLVQHSL